MRGKRTVYLFLIEEGGKKAKNEYSINYQRRIQFLQSNFNKNVAYKSSIKEEEQMMRRKEIVESIIIAGGVN